MTRCSIVPPHVLAALARSDRPGPALVAARTLAIDASLRHERLPAGSRPTIAPPVRQGVAGPHRTIHDARGGEELPGEVVRVEGGPATGDPAADEAHDGLGLTWQLWAQEYGRDSLDGAGMPLVATVHYAEQYDNAFWNGEQMVFGDGDGETFGRFTASLDVIGHELAHGVTEHTAGLVYRGQSGALNEHVSDVFGVLVKQRHLGQSADEADWLIGAELLLPGVQGHALRSMAAPGTAYDDPRLGRDPQPAHMDDFVRTSDDNGGVHINSGIPNKAFHLVATTIGGPAWQAPGLIWRDVLLGEISADCDFATFADLTLAAATDRYGRDSAEAAAVADAWRQVGVTPAGEGSAPAPTREQPEPVDGAAEDAALRLTRTGGVAGLTRTRELTLRELPEPDARAFRSLIEGPQLPRLADEAPPRPDAFCYGLSCERPELDVQVAEAALPQATRRLFERTLRREG
ncbi:protealysin inhibitor emfourin [Janibacter indicus]